MEKVNVILRKCKTLSRQLSRSSSYSSLRSKSTRETIRLGRKQHHDEDEDDGGDPRFRQFETILVGSSRKQYLISSHYLNHPLINALKERSNAIKQDDMIVLNCEVVLFDHLLWMIENSDQNLILDSLEELADLYVF